MDIVTLCGGLSAERDVSLASGAMAADALRRRGHRVALVDLFFGYTQNYNNPKEIFERASVDDTASINENAPDLDALRQLRDCNSRVGENIPEICRAADIVFIALHGEDGEDGKIQAMLDLLGVKYTGTGALGSTIAMNKALSKQLFSLNGINTPRGIVLHKDEKPDLNIGFPCVVKPCSGGSSVGTSIVEAAADYPSALEYAFCHGDEVIVEQYIKGRECSVGVLAGRALPVIEIRPKTGFFDYKNKYQSGMTEEICPAQFSPEITEKLQRTAERVFDALKFDVYGRMDFIVNDDGNPYCLEGNTLPGLTAMSLLPQEAAAAGIGYDELCETIVYESLKKYETGGKP